MSVLDYVHGQHIYKRRVAVLGKLLADLVPHKARVLDVGCGDGLIASLICRARPDVMISGIDVLVRPESHIPIESFDGHTIPYEKSSFDVVMFVDVLHHTNDPTELLTEAVRVTREHVVIKDHTRNGLMAGPTLRLMDWVGNARHSVVLPYNFWPFEKWMTAFGHLNLDIEVFNRHPSLYPPPLAWIFGRSLHFVSRLRLKSPNDRALPV